MDTTPVLAKRVFTLHREKRPDEDTITVFSWNILADCLALPSKEFPDPVFPEVDPAILTWDYRKERILATIVEHEPDLICLAEVDHFYDFFLPRLEEKGYQGLWVKKQSEMKDGPAMFWKRSKFTLGKYQTESLGGTSQVAHFAIFHINGNPWKPICFVATHLKAKPGFEKIRKRQMKFILRKLTSFNISKIEGTVIIAPFIICGDFNDVPNSPINRLLMKHYMGSAYDVGLESTLEARVPAPWTTWKKRESVVKRTIDYIWYDSRPNTDNEGITVPTSGYLVH